MINSELTICIPTYKNFQQLEWCLHSLVRHTEYPFKIVLVNNDPTPYSKETVEALAKQTDYALIEVLHPKENLKWMKAINLGFKHCDTQYFCMMNDDVVFPPESRVFWRRLTRHFKLKEVGAVGPCSNFVAGNQNLFNLARPEMFETSMLIGFCNVVRSDVFRKIGGLDEELIGGDDLDLSIRIRNEGYTLICDKSAYLHHIGQQTGRRVHADFWDSDSHQEQSNNQLIKKHGFLKWNEIIENPWWVYGSKESTDVNNWELSKNETEQEWYTSYLEKFPEDAKGLNLGCGDQETPEFIYGLDLSRKGESSSGGQKFAEATPDTTANASDLPVSEKSVDVIMVPHLLEHIVDPLNALEEWKRVLKDDGMILMTMPNHDYLPTMLIDYTHVHAYTPKSATKLLEINGFEVVEVVKNISSNFAIAAKKGD